MTEEFSKKAGSNCKDEVTVYRDGEVGPWAVRSLVLPAGAHLLDIKMEMSPRQLDV